MYYSIKAQRKTTSTKSAPSPGNPGIGTRERGRVRVHDRESQGSLFVPLPPGRGRGPALAKSYVYNEKPRKSLKLCLVCGRGGQLSRTVRDTS